MAQFIMESDEVSRVTDQELIERLRCLVRADQAHNARLIVHLGEVDARGLYREHAYSSMFLYCVEEFGMSEAEAYLRIHAARLGRQYPLVVQLLAQGSLNLTAIKLLGPHLTADNHVQLLEQASGKRKREVELLVATIAPQPDVPNRMRKLPEARAAHATRPAAQLAPTGLIQAALALEAARTSSALDARQALSTPPEAGNLEEPRPRASSKPLGPGRYKLALTARQSLHDKLEKLQELLRHQVPNGDLAVILERAVDMLLDDTMKRRFAQSSAPKRKPRSVKRTHRPRKANSRYVPRAVVREVHQRDGGQCTFVSSDGKRCSERGFLQFHHHDLPYGKGGKATPENLRLACRAHNALFAERDYGQEYMRSKLRQTRDAIDKLGPARQQE
jgi:hypothetical protein